jgi:hypothetical protein
MPATRTVLPYAFAVLCAVVLVCASLVLCALLSPALAAAAPASSAQCVTVYPGASVRILGHPTDVSVQGEQVLGARAHWYVQARQTRTSYGWRFRADEQLVARWEVRAHRLSVYGYAQRIVCAWYDTVTPPAHASHTYTVSN